MAIDLYFSKEAIGCYHARLARWRRAHR